MFILFLYKCIPQVDNIKVVDTHENVIYHECYTFIMVISVLLFLILFGRVAAIARCGLLLKTE